MDLKTIAIAIVILMWTAYFIWLYWWFFVYLRRKRIQ